MAEQVEIKNELNTLESEIKDFINSQPYWAQYLCFQILENSEIAEDKIETAFSYLLEELGLKNKSVKSTIPNVYATESHSDYFKEDVVFNSLESVENVNALCENQKLELTPNLTIVYGSNGSGKSGYVRLFRKAFYSKIKKDILPNINLSSDLKPVKACFNFTSDGENFNLKFPEDSNNKIFSQFAVFDGEIGKKHLSSRNDFSFRPAGLNLFNEFNNSLEKLNSKLKDEIAKRSIVNPFADEDIFPGESPIKAFLISLSAESDFTKVDKYLPFTEIDKKRKDEVEKHYDDLKIRLAQKDKSLKSLKRIKTLLYAKKTEFAKINKFFTSNQFNMINSFISDYKNKQKLAQEKGIEKFKTDKISNIDTAEWKNFIIAANKFANIQTSLKYPSEGDYCLFCQQPLKTDSSINLIHSYWEYIKSVVEQDVKAAKKKIEEKVAEYKEIQFNQFPESDTLTIWLKEKHESCFNYFIDILEKQDKLAQSIINNLIKSEIFTSSEVQVDLHKINMILADVEKEIKMFEEDGEFKTLSKMLEEKTYLAHKEKLELRLPQIKELYANMIWVNRAKIGRASCRERV